MLDLGDLVAVRDSRQGRRHIPHVDGSDLVDQKPRRPDLMISSDGRKTAAVRLGEVGIDRPDDAPWYRGRAEARSPRRLRAVRDPVSLDQIPHIDRPRPPITRHRPASQFPRRARRRRPARASTATSRSSSVAHGGSRRWYVHPDAIAALMIRSSYSSVENRSSSPCLRRWHLLTTVTQLSRHPPRSGFPGRRLLHYCVAHTIVCRMLRRAALDAPAGAAARAPSCWPACSS